MRALIVVSVEIKSADGKAMWRNRTSAGGLTQKENEAKYTYEQLIAEPARIEEILARAANLVAGEAMADL